MAQCGSTTVIGPGIEVLLLDCFETLVEREGDGYRPRLGMLAFLRHYQGQGLCLAVVSDGPEVLVRKALMQAGVSRLLKGVFHRGDSVDSFDDGQPRKRLDRVLAALGYVPQVAVFIGDSPLDARAAETYGLDFIRVPRSEDRSFSFVRLIGGASRYSSSEMLVHLQDRPQRGQPS
jgi:phosphoglycolate phosphatase-like HAD superfamily hydrolase